MGLAPLIRGSKRDNGIVRLDNERDPIFHRTKYSLESFYELLMSYRLARNERQLA